MDGFLGEIRLFAADFAPARWALCQGQLLPINQYQALFSILGTTYGGNGSTTFALPDYRGRTPVGFGSGNSLSTYTLGQKTGKPNNTLTSNQLPEHTHAITCTMAPSYTYCGSTGVADAESPVDNYFAAGDGTQKFDAQHDGVVMPFNIPLDNAGSNTPAPISNMMPYQAIHFIICIMGVYPT